MRTARSLTVSPSMLCVGGRGVPGPEGVPGPGGSVPGTRGGGVPGLGVYLIPGGVPGSRGCTWSRGVYLVQGSVPGPRRVYLVLGGDVPGLAGCTWSQGVYLVPGGLLSGGVYLVPGGSAPGPGGCLLQVWGVSGTPPC